MRYADQRPRKSWEAGLRSKGIQFRGIRYVIDLRGVVNDRHSAVLRLRELGQSFCEYVLATTVACSPTTALASARASTASKPTSDGAQLPAFSPFLEDDELIWVEGTAELLATVQSEPRFVDVPEKTRLALVNARIGQGGYRSRLLDLWGHCCSLTGCDVSEVLIASHAKPWSECDVRDCLNEYNGPLLTANLDKLFEHGSIAFADDGTLLVASSLPRVTQEDLGLLEHRGLRFVQEQHRPYLRWHREHRFSGR